VKSEETIKDLVERFTSNIDAYKSGKYNEAQVRCEFIDPMFKNLGWDMDNEKGYAEAYKDVIHEDAIKIGGATKAPDYCFRIGGTRKFFVEAKKPSVNLKHDISASFQLRRYAWSAKLPLSILTDFEEFAVYDCRIKPHKNDKASNARTFYIYYTEYVDRWDEIASIFSREAILRGSFDKYVESKKLKRGTAEVDTAFLEEIESWRETLARNIALRNPQLTRRELNFAVQRTIDRVIFLRICEDRGIEDYGKLMALLNGNDTYRRLCQLFHRADERYNSGLFHFERERGRNDPPDELTTNLTIDDKVLKNMIKNLYYPESPYEFSVLPADILGQVYEQFLGKVIKLTPGHRAVVEEKPEVKKAGGVYYTPTYIVDYIVKHTVGKLVEGKKPGKRGGVSKLKILDPACGSGSFLIGAYQYLLDWHRDKYIEDGPEKHKKELFQGSGGEWKLTTSERKRILLNNIYGVDIDPQAVEVTKLSLLLKVLEGETKESVATQLTFFHERALPDLSNNIKCGNSLISSDFYDNQQMSFLDEEEQYRINVFDWKAEFPEIFKGKNPGFDAVIGNPPYRMLQPHNTKASLLVYLREHYLASDYKIDLYHLFLQRAVLLLKDSRYLGYIVPTTILNNVYLKSLRSWLMKRSYIESISVALGKVFSSADVHTSVIILRREFDIKKQKIHYIQTTTELSESFVEKPALYSQTLQSRFLELLGQVWNVLINEMNATLIFRLMRDFSSLKNVSKINRGLVTGNSKKYFSTEKKSDSYVAIIEGRNVHRYYVIPPSKFVLFKRPKTAGGCWSREVHFAPHKLVIRQISKKPTASILHEPLAVNANIFTVRASNFQEELYLLGIINSTLIAYFWRIMFSDFKTSFPQVTIFSLSQVPIRILDINKPSEKALHDRMVELVDLMLSLHKRLSSARIPGDKTRLQRRIDATDRQIDKLVYELYGLTEEEIGIVEGNNI